MPKFSFLWISISHEGGGAQNGWKAKEIFFYLLSVSLSFLHSILASPLSPSLSTRRALVSWDPISFPFLLAPVKQENWKWPQYKLHLQTKKEISFPFYRSQWSRDQAMLAMQQLRTNLQFLQRNLFWISANRTGSDEYAPRVPILNLFMSSLVQPTASSSSYSSITLTAAMAAKWLNSLL